MESSRKRNKILLVDDEPDLTMTFKAILQRVGFAVDTYEDPLAALSNFRPHYYDLVILDIKMPKMNGFELYSEMLEIDSQVKVCFVTAGEMYYDNVRKNEEEQYCELDTERFIQKPISNADLVRRINRVMMLGQSPNIRNR
ncbi:MAG TPA: response regulator [Nitrososphaeraceae archaeon]|jgi:DNA-binding response OmpR family regulator|nr:response regulator [Nitrososphaeraceae archaeon]